jgi:hypothetical protein
MTCSMELLSTRLVDRDDSIISCLLSICLEVYQTKHFFNGRVRKMTVQHAYFLHDVLYHSDVLYDVKSKLEA